MKKFEKDGPSSIRAARLSLIIGAVVLVVSLVSYLIPLSWMMMMYKPKTDYYYLYEIFSMLMVFGPSVSIAFLLAPWASAAKAEQPSLKLMRVLKVSAVVVLVIALVPVMVYVFLGTFGPVSD